MAERAPVARRREDQDEDVTIHHELREGIFLPERIVLDGLQAGRNATNDLIEALPAVNLLQLREVGDVYCQEPYALALRQGLADVGEEYREGGQRGHRIEQQRLHAFRARRT